MQITPDTTYMDVVRNYQMDKDLAHARYEVLLDIIRWDKKKSSKDEYIDAADRYIADHTSEFLNTYRNTSVDIEIPFRAFLFSIARSRRTSFFGRGKFDWHTGEWPDFWKIVGFES